MAEQTDDKISEQDARIEETFQINKELNDDLEELSDHCNAGHQGARRAYVRGAFALIEAMTYRMKASALEIGRQRLEPGEVQLLEETEYALNDKGAVQQRSPKLKTLPNVRFTLKMLAKAADIDKEVNFGVKGWEAMDSAIKTRDRLMHPRQLVHLQVDDGQLREAMDSVVWFTSVVLTVFSLLHEKHARDAGMEHMPLQGLVEFKSLIEDSLGKSFLPRRQRGRGALKSGDLGDAGGGT